MKELTTGAYGGKDGSGYFAAKGQNIMIASRQPMTDAQLWQVAQDVQTAYRAALKPTAVLPTSFDRWLRERTREIQ